jgi:hypothetical protein
MDTQVLTEGLRALSPGAMEWKFALYTAGKDRDGVTLTWNLCKMADIAGWVETVRDALLKKPVADKPVAPYTPFLSDRENIAAIEASDEMISRRTLDLRTDIKNAKTRAPDDFASGSAPKPTGYAFAAEDDVGEPVVLLRRSNPFLTGSARLCDVSGGEVRTADRPILKLAPSVDFLLLGGVCYLFSSGVGKDFELEDRHFAIAAKRLAHIAQMDIVSNIEALEKAAFTPRNARKFACFEKQVLEYIARLKLPEREEFLATYAVTVDHNGRIDASDAEQCELIIDLLCCRSCLDPLGRLAVGSDITVRE